MAKKNKEIPQEQWQKFNQLVLQKTGLLFTDQKKLDLERGIMAVLSKSPYNNLDELYLALSSNTQEQLFDELISEITVGETYFYRDENQFELLKEEVLPSIIQEAKTSKKLKIWSAGCATGEEPYTVAILLKELLPNIDEWDILILATDINKKALAKAKEGVYSNWSFRGMPPYFKRYFIQNDKNFHIRTDLKSLVTFTYLNLKDNLFPSFFNHTVNLDLIICRNVTIYLQPVVTADIFCRFYESLRPGGWLLLGASDPAPNKLNFSLQAKNGTFIYKKEEKSPPKATTSISEPLIKPFKERQKQVQTELVQEENKKQQIQFKVEQNKVDLLAKARELLKQNKLKEAEALLQQHVAKNYAVPEAYFLLGLINEVNKSMEAAVDYLKKAVYLKPDYLEAHFILASVYKKLHQEEKALVHFKKVIKLSSGQPNLAQIVPGTNGLTYAHLKEVAELELVKGAEHVC